MGGCFCHNGITVSLFAPAKDLCQFFRRQALFLQPIQEISREGILYRFSVENSTAFLLQERQIVFQRINILLLAQRPIVPGNATSFKENGHCFRACLDGDLFPAKGNRNRVIVCIKADGCKPICPAQSTFTRIEGISGKRVQLFLLIIQHFSHGGRLPSDLMRQILPAFL